MKLQADRAIHLFLLFSYIFWRWGRCYSVSCPLFHCTLFSMRDFFGFCTVIYTRLTVQFQSAPFAGSLTRFPLTPSIVMVIVPPLSLTAPLNRILSLRTPFLSEDYIVHPSCFLYPAFPCLTAPFLIPRSSLEGLLKTPLNFLELPAGEPRSSEWYDAPIFSLH